MGAKKKVAVAVIAIFMLVLATIIAVVAVFALQQVSIQSKVNITYQANIHVVAKIDARYEMQDSTKNDDFGSVEFDGTGKVTGSDIVDVGNLELKRGDNEWVTFYFTFENKSSLDDFTAYLKFTDGSTGDGTIDNISLESKVDGATDANFTNDLSGLTEVKVEAGETVVYSLKISVPEKNKNATFEGTFVWDLVVDGIS